MCTKPETEELLRYLEDVLVRLSRENYQPRGSCGACLQDVEMGPDMLKAQPSLSQSMISEPSDFKRARESFIC